MTDKQPDKGRYDWEDGDVILEASKQYRALMRVVAEVVINEEKARAAADQDLRERLDAIETIEPALPAELVEQLKSAVAALAEPPPAPPVARASDPPQETPRSMTGAVITRSGELAVSYSDGRGERLGHVIGPQGEKGTPGERGEPGRDGVGIKGEDGPPGRDGVSVTAASINRDGELQLTLSDGSVLTPGVVAPKRK